MDIPPGNNGSDTFVRGVNSFGDIVGFDRRGWLAKKIELGEGTGDSGEMKPTFTRVLFPGTQSGLTFPFAINDVRGIVGGVLSAQAVKSAAPWRSRSRLSCGGSRP